MGLRRGLVVAGALCALVLVRGWISGERASELAVGPPTAATPSVEPERNASALREPEPAPRARPTPLERPSEVPPQEPQSPGLLDLGPLDWIDASELPPDPPESGPASLTLRLVDARTGEPLASRVELWRVDAPENEGWSAGDQLQATLEVPLDGARLAGLPEGRYRAACARADAGAELPEFDLRAPHTAIELPIELPREFELRVHFVDRFGEPYASVEWWEENLRTVEPPSAVRNSRSPRGVDGMFWSHSTAWAFRRPSRAQQAEQSDEGLLLGRHRASTLERGLLPVLRLRAPDGALAEVEVPARGEGVVRLVVVGLPADVAASRVRLPDGRASAAQVEALGLAHACTDPRREWRSAPVRLKAELAGFAPVERQWRAEDGELPWILLESADGRAAVE